MAMTVRTNTSALLAQDALRSNQSKVSTAMQRLSTGLRINSAKDDAAGLAIGNKMTSQIRGFSQALRNIQDGISLLQTADSALNSISNLLQRMRELTIQASTDTYSDEQRSFLHLEAMQVQAEIERIKEATTWNGKTVLDGTFIDQKIQIGANHDETFPVSINGAGLTEIGLVGRVNSNSTGSITETAKINFTALKIGQSITIEGLKFIAKKDSSAEEITNAFSNLQAGASSGGGISYGEYSGTFRNYYTGVANGNEVIATSTILDTNVSDITIFTSGVDKLSLPVLSILQGNSSVVGHGSINSINFNSLLAYQSVQLGGLKFTASKDLTADEVAAAFASIGHFDQAGLISTNGFYTQYGSQWNYSSGAASGDTVDVTANWHSNNQSPISKYVYGLANLVKPYSVVTQGEPLYSGNPEVAQIQFSDLQPNQTITIRNNNRWLAFTATTFLSAGQVATIFENRQSNNYFSYNSSYGYFNTIGDPFSTGPANGSTVTFFSNYLMPAPISASSGLGVNGNTDNIPQPSVVTITQGASPTGATEINKIYFDSIDMVAGQSISIGGLRFTANKHLTGAQVAAAFAGLSPNDTNGSVSTSEGNYSGIFSGEFSTGSVTQVPYTTLGNTHYHTILNVTSTSANTNVADLEIIGSPAIAAPALPTSTFTQGVADVLARTESNTFKFPSMQIGQSLEIAGLKFTATSTLSAYEVASAFANLTDGQTTGSQQSFGMYSGVLSGFRTGSVSNDQVNFTSTILAADVEDINYSSGDFISAPPKPLADINQGYADGVSLMTTSLAQSSLKRIDYAINTVDSIRATLGGHMNALVNISNNVTNVSQNLEVSRSTIMDTDYAIETTNLASSKIIEQAASAILAQANMQPKIILELLKNL